MNKNRVALLHALAAGRVAKRDHLYTWRWINRWEGAPSLNNTDTSALTRGALLREEETTDGTFLRLDTGGEMYLLRQAQKEKGTT